MVHLLATFLFLGSGPLEVNRRGKAQATRGSCLVANQTREPVDARRPALIARLAIAVYNGRDISHHHGDTPNQGRNWTSSRIGHITNQQVAVGVEHRGARLPKRETRANISLNLTFLSEKGVT
ncbi:uncharacterized protein BCR38DRAFT_37838 [Pseudomassariella vexata]|uniref:Secreted protein n=1 Tax=Pseudomassariella vexata TaxID=1141098 RepID=A0A1Y2DQR7_9PEZI|nr:uncharacterized protein BCR38DRAFT_37838 [Pseudomassariella vexata]ORY61642.1 hypothetical protein BCR38DRAFT_37838 [Pseudomassariella vexata]